MFPLPRMRGVQVKPFPGSSFHPSIGDATARKDERVCAVSFWTTLIAKPPS